MIDVSASGHYIGDCRELLKQLPDACVQTCITSPPYWGLRDYGHADQIGLEPTPDEYVANMVGVFREVHRALKPDGTLWLNLGDSYTGNVSPGGTTTRTITSAPNANRKIGLTKSDAGLKQKDLVGIPWLVAFALRADGWYLRSDIIWHKPNPMPESVTDRPTRAHEYVFLLSKSGTYFYDADAVREQMLHPELARSASTKQSVNAGRRSDYQKDSGRNDGGSHVSGPGFRSDPDAGRNKRSVWTVASQHFAGSHFATMPPALVDPCVLAGSRPGDVVLDPFFGSGTTGMVAEKHGRRWIGFDLNLEYEKLQKQRTAQRTLPLVAETR